MYNKKGEEITLDEDYDLTKGAYVLVSAKDQYGNAVTSLDWSANKNAIVQIAGLHQPHRIGIDVVFQSSTGRVAVEHIGCQFLAQSFRNLAAARIMDADKSYLGFALTVQLRFVGFIIIVDVQLRFRGASELYETRKLFEECRDGYGGRLWDVGWHHQQRESSRCGRTPFRVGTAERNVGFRYTP